ncbi:MAG: transposase [Planctomycetota bacterium]
MLDQVDPAVWVTKWNVDIKPVGSGQAVLKYLAPYVYRVAISDHRLVSFDKSEAPYKIKPSGENRYRERTTDACRLVGGFLQHVVPGGFQKFRYYGWKSPITGCRWTKSGGW